MKFKTSVLFALSFMSMHLCQATPHAQDLLTDITLLLNQKIDLQKTPEALKATFAKFIEDGGDINKVFINPATGCNTTILIWSIDSFLLELVLLALQHGADPLLQDPQVGFSAVDYVVNQHLSLQYMIFTSSGDCSATVYEIQMNVIIFTLLISFVPKNIRKDVFDKVISQYTNFLKQNDVNVAQWIETVVESRHNDDDYEELDSLEKALAFDISTTNDDDDVDEHAMAAQECLFLHAEERLFTLYLELLPQDLAQQYRAQFAPFRCYEQPLEMSQWWKFVSLANFLYVICA